MEQVILVVEDEPLIGLEIQEQLERSGYLVPLVAQNGAEAITAVKQINPDLIMLDIRLPGALDGIETARIIQADRDVPILYLTAFSDQNTVNRATDTDPDAYLVKPFNERELLANINLALKKHQRRVAGSQTLSGFTAVVDTMVDPTLVLDPQGRVFHCNLSASRILGMPDAGGFNGHDLCDFIGLVEFKDRAIMAGTFPLLPEITRNIEPFGQLRVDALMDRNGNIRGFTATFEEATIIQTQAILLGEHPELVLHIRQDESSSFMNTDLFMLDGNHVAFYLLETTRLGLDPSFIQARLRSSFKEITQDVFLDQGLNLAPVSIVSRLNRSFMGQDRAMVGFDLILAIMNTSTGEWNLARSGSPRCYLQQPMGMAVALATQGSTIKSSNELELETAHGQVRGDMHLTLCAGFVANKAQPGMDKILPGSGISVGLGSKFQ